MLYIEISIFFNLFPFNNNMQKIFLALFSVVFFCSLIGCNDGNPGTVPVSITVTQKGTPVPDVGVSLIPTDSRAQLESASGTTNSSGVAVLETAPKWRGAMPGEYGVALKKWEQIATPAPMPGAPNNMSITEKSVLPAKYGNHSTSGFTLTVGKKATKATFDIDE